MFTFYRVETDDELKELFSLRYQVYCIERRYEPEENYPDNCEFDEYDIYSIHLIAKINNKAVGTARLILNNPLGFPVEKYCNSRISTFGIKKEKVAEISRFAISNQISKAMDCDRKKIIIGLFREIYKESKKMGIEYFCAAMGRSLQKLLSKYGIVFSSVGQIVDYHGMRSLHLSKIENLEDNIVIKNRELFQYITSRMPKDIQKSVF